MTAWRSAILTYHSLDDSGSVISMPPERFRRQMEFLASSSVPVVPLDEALRRPNCVAITFDDGFRNLLDHAVPLLDRLRLPATIFVVSGYCGGSNNWPSQPSGVPGLRLMDWRDLASLPAWISIGAHTNTHPRLPALPEAECERELLVCQNQIEQHLGRPTRWLAYPYGSRSASVMAAAGRHFDFAVGTSLQFVSSRSCALDLPRIDAYYLRGRFTLERLLRPSGALYIGFRRVLHNVRGFNST
ncbi:MAG: polysaccharide deacetylase family protein [Bryobacteraceae bacterium]